MTYSNKIRVLSVVCALFLLSACGTAKEASFGEKLQYQGVEMRDIGQQWSKGEKQANEGYQLIESGEKQITKGETMVSKGKALVKSGERLKTQAEIDYKAQTGVAMPVSGM